MRRARTTVIEEIKYPLFQGTAFSNAECQFLIDHLGESVVEALDGEDELPEGVNDLAVEPMLKLVFDLETRQRLRREREHNPTLKIWVGIKALQTVLQETLKWRETVAELKRQTRGSSPELRRAAGCPSLHLWDPTTDNPSLGGIGADADIVMTALGPQGLRIPLTTELMAAGNGGGGAIKTLAGVAQFIGAKSQAEQQTQVMRATPDDLLYEEIGELGTIKCPICGKSEEYSLNNSKTKQQALTRIKQHLKLVKVKSEQHRLLLDRLNSGRAGTAKNRQRLEEREEARTRAEELDEMEAEQADA